MRRLVSSLTLGVLTLSAVPAFAASEAAVSTDLKTEVLENITISTPTSPATGLGGGGGGVMMDAGMSRSMIYPPYQQGGVTVDVSLTKEVTPDIIILNAWCQEDGTSRQVVRAALNQLYKDTVAKVGKEGRVRRSGLNVNPTYDMSGKMGTNVTGSLNLIIRFTKTTMSQSISDWLEDRNCSNSWDVRLMDPQGYEMKTIDELITKLAARKALFEKLLGKKLTEVQSAYLSTYLDGYSSYDPMSNTADATTTLSVTFVVPGKSTVTPKPVPMTR